MGIAAAIAGAAVVGAGATIVSGNKASSAATKAASSNNALQAQIYNENEAALSPYEQRGNAAGTQINALLGIGGQSGSSATADQTNAFNNYLNGTGYTFQLNQGLKSTEAALGAKGLLDSGAASKSLNNYAQNQALTGFNSYLSALQGQQSTGMGAASAQAGVGQSYANSVSANNNAAATATGNAALSGASSINSTLGSALTAYGYTQGLGSSYGAGNANAGLGGIY